MQTASSHADPQADLQKQLLRLNHVRLIPSLSSAKAHAMLSEENALRRLELEFVESEREAVREESSVVPTTADAFLRWFRSLETDGPGQSDPLFVWLENHATLAQMRWFVAQEAAGEAGFDDLVALVQLRLPLRAKLEMARNYWDEMGRGKAGGAHSAMFNNLLEYLHIDLQTLDAIWQTRALGNLMCALAGNRAYAYQAIGALGVIELTAPGRAAAVNAGLKRLGLPLSARKYYAVHATLDIQHACSWMSEVLAPLVDTLPEAAPLIAEGALMRLRAGARAFATYRAHLWYTLPC